VIPISALFYGLTDGGLCAPKDFSDGHQIKYLRHEAATRAHQASLGEALALCSGLWEKKKKALNIWAAGSKAKK